MMAIRVSIATAVLLLLACSVPSVAAPRLAIIGDSLSAEYEMIPDFPGTENPTEYARVSINGWESMSWVEVLGRMRPDSFDFGSFRSDLLGWFDLRFSGYEFNFAIPGFRAAQYEDIVNSSIVSNPQYLPFRLVLQNVLKNKADRVLIWLGANEFRSNFGALARGADPARLIANLIGDLEEVVEFVQAQNPGLQLAIATIPDLSAAPDKRGAHPDAAERARVTSAIRIANDAIAALARDQSIAVADLFSQSQQLLAGIPTFFGPVKIIDAIHPDNHPRFHFTRDGLHPNTPSQIEIARVIIDTFNAYYGAEIPQITDAEALKFLGLDPLQPYLDWMAQYRTSANRMGDDPDADGMPNIVELAFGTNPVLPSLSPIEREVASGHLKISFRPNADSSRLLEVVLESSADLTGWETIPFDSLTVLPDGTRSLNLPTTSPAEFVRMNVRVREFQ